MTWKRFFWGLLALLLVFFVMESPDEASAFVKCTIAELDVASGQLGAFLHGLVRS